MFKPNGSRIFTWVASYLFFNNFIFPLTLPRYQLLFRVLLWRCLWQIIFFVSDFHQRICIHGLIMASGRKSPSPPLDFQCLALLQPIGYQQMFCKQKFEMYLCSSTCSLILQASPSKEKESESQCCNENKRNKEQTCSLEPNPCRSAKHKLKYRCMSEKQILIFRSQRIWGCFATLLWWQLTNTVLSNLQVLFSFDDYKFLKNNKFLLLPTWQPLLASLHYTYPNTILFNDSIAGRPLNICNHLRFV